MEPEKRRIFSQDYLQLEEIRFPEQENIKSHRLTIRLPLPDDDGQKSEGILVLDNIKFPGMAPLLSVSLISDRLVDTGNLPSLDGSNAFEISGSEVNADHRIDLALMHGSGADLKEIFAQENLNLFGGDKKSLAVLYAVAEAVTSELFSMDDARQIEALQGILSRVPGWEKETGERTASAEKKSADPPLGAIWRTIHEAPHVTLYRHSDTRFVHNLDVLVPDATSCIKAIRVEFTKAGKDYPPCIQIFAIPQAGEEAGNIAAEILSQIPEENRLLAEIISNPFNTISLVFDPNGHLGHTDAQANRAVKEYHIVFDALSSLRFLGSETQGTAIREGVLALIGDMSAENFFFDRPSEEMDARLNALSAHIQSAGEQSASRQYEGKMSASITKRNPEK